MDNVPEETHVVSVMMQRPPATASGNSGCDQRPRGRLSSSAPNSTAKQTDGEKGDMEESSDKRSQIVCRVKFCKNPSCKFWHPPVCLNYKSDKGCINGDKCLFRLVESEGKPSKKSKGTVAILKESIQLGCVSQDSYLRKSIQRKSGKLGSNHTVKLSKGTWHHIKIRKRKGPSRGVIQKCAPHERSACAPKFDERSQDETLQQERCARRAAWDLVEIFHKPKNSDIRYVLYSH